MDQQGRKRLRNAGACKQGMLRRGYSWCRKRRHAGLGVWLAHCTGWLHAEDGWDQVHDAGLTDANGFNSMLSAGASCWQHYFQGQVRCAGPTGASSLAFLWKRWCLTNC